MTPEMVQSAVRDIEQISDIEREALLDSLLWTAWPTQAAQNQ